MLDAHGGGKLAAFGRATASSTSQAIGPQDFITRSEAPNAMPMRMARFVRFFLQSTNLAKESEQWVSRFPCS
jgi:hypothetical protein